MGYVKFIKCTQTEYNSLTKKDPDALYFIIPETKNDTSINES